MLHHTWRPFRGSSLVASIRHQNNFLRQRPRFRHRSTRQIKTVQRGDFCKPGLRHRYFGCRRQYPPTKRDDTSPFISNRNHKPVSKCIIMSSAPISLQRKARLGNEFRCVARLVKRINKRGPPGMASPIRPFSLCQWTSSTIRYSSGSALWTGPQHRFKTRMHRLVHQIAARLRMDGNWLGRCLVSSTPAYQRVPNCLNKAQAPDHEKLEYISTRTAPKAVINAFGSHHVEGRCLLDGMDISQSRLRVNRT